jgi:hypothetical protein
MLRRPCFQNEPMEDHEGGSPEVFAVSERATSTRSLFPVFQVVGCKVLAPRNYCVNHLTIEPAGIHYLLVISVYHDNLFSHCDLIEVHRLIKVDSCKHKCNCQCQCACYVIKLI